MHDQNIPYGYCECSCGQKTEPAKQTIRKIGWIKGEPKRYIHGHQSRKRKDTQYIIDPDTGCWVWQWTKTRNGYGLMRDGNSKRMYAAHRVFYERAKGPIPEGLQLDHLCRNRACVNPDHLEPVTNTENVRRGLRPKLTLEQVRDIRSRPRTYGSAVALAREFTVDVSTIYRARSQAEGAWVDE